MRIEQIGQILEIVEWIYWKGSPEALYAAA